MLATFVLLSCSCACIPESVVVIVLGAIIGFSLRFVNDANVPFHMRVGADTLLLFIVPPIIFDSGYSLHKV